jgi:hypothetical protein
MSVVGAMGLVMEAIGRDVDAGVERIAVRTAVEVRAVRAAADMLAVVLG